MAGKKRFANGTIQYTFKKAGLLDKPIYLTFEDEAEGDDFARKLEAMLDAGIVPEEFRTGNAIRTLSELVREYELEAHPSSKDKGALNAALKRWGDKKLSSINAAWVDQIIADMKRLEKLAPATIRARIGALARATDWGMRKQFLVMPDHPFRTLPDGYAQYSKSDIVESGVKRQDMERDRRLEKGEHESILALIDGGVLPRKQRPLHIEFPIAHRVFYLVALETAMRMREIYTLSLDQLDLARKTIFLEKTKNGDKRQVPLSSVAVKVLTEYLVVREIPGAHRQDLLFPFWSGAADERSLVETSDYLSTRFIDIFKCAGAEGLKFHDLRHEATSRLFERTKLSETAIMRITGHKSHRMMMRYTNLRGSDLANELW